MTTDITQDAAKASPHDVPRNKMRARRPRQWSNVGFVLPGLVLIAIFLYSPLVQAVRYSTTNWDGINPPRSVGLANYQYLLHSSDFHRILLNELVLMLGIAVWVATPFVLACVLHGMRGSGPARAVLFIPPLLPPVVVGTIFRIVLADRGPLNSLLGSVSGGQLRIHWLTSDWLVLVSVILVITWATSGVGVLIFSAGLATLDEELIDAARIDGASWPKIVWNVYRPHLQPIARFLVLLFTVATAVSFFPWILPLTGGGPGTASTTLDFDVWASGVRDGQAGLASAIGVVTVLVIAVVLAGQLAVARLARHRE